MYVAKRSCYLVGELRMEFVWRRIISICSPLPTSTRITCQQTYFSYQCTATVLCRNLTLEYCPETLCSLIKSQGQNCIITEYGLGAPAGSKHETSPNLAHAWNSMTTCLRTQKTHCPSQNAEDSAALKISINPKKLRMRAAGEGTGYRLAWPEN